MYTPLHKRLIHTAASKGAAVLPGSLRSPELGRLLSNPESVNEKDIVDKLYRLQAIRERCAAMGVLAWYLAYTDLHPNAGEAGQPVTVWGRTHGSSFTDMFDSIGVKPVDTIEWGGNPQGVDVIHLPAHSRRWTESRLQKDFQSSLKMAKALLDK